MNAISPDRLTTYATSRNLGAARADVAAAEAAVQSGHTVRNEVLKARETAIGRRLATIDGQVIPAADADLARAYDVLERARADLRVARMEATVVEDLIPADRHVMALIKDLEAALLAGDEARRALRAQGASYGAVDGQVLSRGLSKRVRDFFATWSPAYAMSVEIGAYHARSFQLVDSSATEAVA